MRSVAPWPHKMRPVGHRPQTCQRRRGATPAAAHASRQSRSHQPSTAGPRLWPARLRAPSAKPSQPAASAPGVLWHHSAESLTRARRAPPGSNRSAGSSGAPPNSSAAKSRIPPPPSDHDITRTAPRSLAVREICALFTEGSAAGNGSSSLRMTAAAMIGCIGRVSAYSRRPRRHVAEGQPGRYAMPRAKNKNRTPATRVARLAGPATPAPDSAQDSAEAAKPGAARASGAARDLVPAQDVPAGLARRPGSGIPAGLARRPGSEISADLARWTANETGERTAARGGTEVDAAAGQPVAADEQAADRGADDVPVWAARALEQLLTVTYWLDPGEAGDPFTATIRFTGHRTDAAGASEAGDSFSQEETVEGIVPGERAGGGHRGGARHQAGRLDGDGAAGHPRRGRARAVRAAHRAGRRQAGAVATAGGDPGQSRRDNAHQHAGTPWCTTAGSGTGGASRGSSPGPRWSSPPPSRSRARARACRRALSWRPPPRRC